MARPLILLEGKMVAPAAGEICRLIDEVRPPDPVAAAKEWVAERQRNGGHPEALGMPKAIRCPAARP